MPNDAGTDVGTVYVLVRTDLGKSQQLVQAVHAVAALVGHFYYVPDVLEWAANGGTLVAVGLATSGELLRWRMELTQECPEAPLVSFHEPDLENYMTAVAIFARRGDRRPRHALRLLPLL